MVVENENTENIDLVTFGCRLNTYESAVMRSHAEAAGLKDAIIFNTCAVTKEAERQARQAIRRARRDHPEKKIIVTGCAAQIDPKGFGAMKEVDRVIGNDLKLRAETWFEDSEDKIQVNDIMSVKETASHLVDGFEGRARAFLQIQNGCNHRCTFCIIPYGRGNSRSVPIGEIYKQVQNVLEQGYKEVVFTGVDVTDYGLDLPGTPTLGQMIRRVLTLVPELPRLRLSSLDPVEIDDDLWDLIANEPRLMPHLHISLQAGDDMVLKRMKRRHLRHDIVNMVERARDLRPDMVFGADIIAGFPTETDEMFENTRRIIEECDIIHNHIFPFSPRPGTPAARMPQVNRDVVKERAAILRETGARQLEAFQKREIGQTRQILIEKDGSGHSEHFLRVKGLKGEAGDLVTQKITETLLH
jgi:threonylcarbamoyladenosine tRNA methylthiotransferase MtaB